MNSESPTDTIPEPIRFQDAMQMYREHIVLRKKDAATCAEMKTSTFVHRSIGRRSATDFHKSRRLLTEEEEDVLVWRCEVLQRAGFAQTPKDIMRIYTRSAQSLRRRCRTLLYWNRTFKISHLYYRMKLRVWRFSLRKRKTRSRGIQPQVARVADS